MIGVRMGRGIVSEEAGAIVLTHEENKGYLPALRTGFESLDSDFVITLDADGEMNPEHIPNLIKYFREFSKNISNLKGT